MLHIRVYFYGHNIDFLIYIKLGLYKMVLSHKITAGLCHYFLQVIEVLSVFEK